MTIAAKCDDRPSYERRARTMDTYRASRAKDFATLILATTGPYLSRRVSELHVLDVGSGYGHTSVELASRCARVVGIEPSEALYRYACRLQGQSGRGNLEFRNQGICELSQHDAYDLVVLDNVFEHVSDQHRALEVTANSLRPGGAVYLLLPNKLWPIEVHYGLPFLSYLPLKLANWYLRLTKRGTDFTDASYAPTYFSLNRMLRARKELSFQYVLPGRLELTAAGRALHYRLGAALIRRAPWLWAVSKAFLVVAVKARLGEYDMGNGDRAAPP